MTLATLQDNNPTITIVPSEHSHVEALAEAIRPEDLREILALGSSAQDGIYESFSNSNLPHTAFIDGKIAAMWGVCGSPLGHIGVPWLITSMEVYKISPLKFVRIYQQEINHMLALFSHLENYVDSRYNASIRLLDIMGFELGEPEPRGIDGQLFIKFWKDSNGN